jgi:hypothetical protein
MITRSCAGVATSVDPSKHRAKAKLINLTFDDAELGRQDSSVDALRLQQVEHPRQKEAALVRRPVRLNHRWMFGR